MKFQLPSIFTLAVLLSLGSTVATSQSQSELRGEGVVVAFHKQWRHPVTPYSSKGTGTPADIWIIRVDRWLTGSIEGRYFLVQYSLYERAVSDREIKQQLRFRVRKTQPGDGPQPCQGMTRVNSSPPFKLRPMQLSDFRRTEAGRSDAIPQLKELSCLIAEKPPTVATPNLEPKGGAQPTPTTR